MISFKRISRTSFLALMILLLAAGCAKPVALAPTVTASPQAASVTPSATATATATSTPEPTATATLRPNPSPTPYGYHAFASAGFAVTIPDSWVVQEKSLQHITVVDPSALIVLTISGQLSDENTGVEAIYEALLEEVEEEVTFTGYKKSTVTLADGIQADRLETVLHSDQPDRDLWLISAERGKRSLTILVSAPLQTLADRQGTMERILESISMFDPQPFDLPHEETLVMLGGTPEGEELDPATTTSSAGDYVGLLFSGLVQLSPDLKLLPDLAESWTIDPGGSIYTFTLREGITFPSGEPITAQDFKDSWERACDPETESTTARTYLGDIVGTKEMLDGKADHIQGVEALDAVTLRVTLDGPKPYFLAKLTYPTTFVVDARQAKSNPEAWMFTPHSTGPFLLRSIDEGEGLVFERNPAYWQPAEAPYLVFLDNAGGSPLSLYDEGTLDLLGVGGKDLKEVSRPSHAHNAELLTSTSLCTQMLMLNPNLPPLDDPQVRKALMLATDRQDMIDRLTEGTALLANAVLPPAMPGARGDSLVPARDVEAAKAALAASKYAGQDIEIRLSASGYADSQREDVSILADQWQKALGVKVVVEYLDPEDFTRSARNQPANVLIYGWCADYPDPENFLDVLFHSQSEFNVSGLKDEQLDGWLEQARTEPAPEERLALYRQAEEHIIEQGYVLPMFHNTLGTLVNPRVSGFLLSAGGARIFHLVKIEN